MSVSIPDDQRRNYELFRDCLESTLFEKLAKPQTKPRRRAKTKSGKKPVESVPDPSTEALDDAKVTDLADFVDYIATETFTCLPTDLKTIDHHDYVANPHLHPPLPLTSADIPTYLPSLPPEITDSLSAYAIINENTQGINEFLAPTLTAFFTALNTAPSATRKDACEICGRDWINLTYHHLIPRFVHEKAVKRGWHRECELQNGAWLCGACHCFVHRFAGHEELARRFYSVELLLGEEEVRRWADWVGRLRWKGR